MKQKISAFLLVSLLLASGPVFAADPPPAPPSGSSVEVLEKKIREESKEKILREDKKEEEPVKYESPQALPGKTPSFFVKEIEVSGEGILSDDEIRSAVKKYENNDADFQTLALLGKEIEGKLREKGYLASVFVPPQKIQDGRVRLQMIIYKMGTLYIEGHKWGWGWKLRSYWRVPKDQPLRFDLIQKSLSGMNSNPDRTVRSYLKPAPEKGVLDVHLKVEDHFPVHAGFSFDNQGAKLTGKRRKGFTVRHNNLLGLDDIFLIGTAFGHDFGAIFLQHLIPLNTYGTRFLWSFSHSQVDPKKEFAPFGINGTSETYGLSLRQKLFQNDRSVFDAYLGYDFKEKRTRQLSVTTAWDKLRVLSFGGTYQLLDAHGFWSLVQDFAFGLPFRGDGYPLTSRNGESSFLKYHFELERTQKLWFGTRGLVHFEGQLSGDKLPPEEEFFLGGMDSVRGYADNDYGADQGLLTRFEYQVPLFLVPKDWKMPYAAETLRDSIKLISFFDYAHGFLRGADEGEHTERTLMGAGGGFRVQFRKNISGVFEWAARLGDAGLIEAGKSQFHYKFQFDV